MLASSLEKHEYYAILMIKLLIYKKKIENY